MKLPDAFFGLGRFNVEAYFRVPQKLVVYQNSTVFEIQVGGKAAKLWNPHPRFREDDKLIRIFGINRVALCKGNEAFFLFRGKDDFFFTVIIQHRVQRKPERIFADVIIIHRCVENCQQRTLIIFNGLVAVAFLAHSDCPGFCIRWFYILNALRTERVIAQQLQKVFTALFRTALDVLFQRGVLDIELAHRYFFADGVDPVVYIPADFLFFFPQGFIIPLASRGLIGGHQFPGIDKLGLPVCVCVLICVSPVFSLALSGS